MKLLDKILLPTDFSKAADDALQMARYVAKTFNAELILLHVIPEIKDSPLSMNLIKEAADQELGKIQESIAGEGIGVKQMVFDSGSPFDHITLQAELNQVNMIMMGAGQKRLNDKYPMGITAERVVRRSNKPVWVVKHGTAPPVKNILCAVDFSQSSERALENAVHLTRQFNGQLTVMHVIPPLSVFYPKFIKMVAQAQEEFKRERTAHFERFLKKFDFYNVNWQQVLKEGKPHEEILGMAKSPAYDLLLLGSEGQTDNARIFLGGVAEKVMRELPCSAITFKSEDIIRLRLESEIKGIQASFNHGKDLLEEGFPEEAIQAFKHCLQEDALFAPALEWLAKAHERLGENDEAKKNRSLAREIREELWGQKVEADIRGQSISRDR